MLEVDESVSDAFADASQIEVEPTGRANLTWTYVYPSMTAAGATVFYGVRGELGDIGTIITPIAAGPMLDGIMKGAQTLKSAGRISRSPFPRDV